MPKNRDESNVTVDAREAREQELARQRQQDPAHTPTNPPPDMTAQFMASPTPAPQPPPEPRPDYITVTAVGIEGGKRRGDYVFTATPQTIKTSDLPPGVYERIKSDPNLKVEGGTALDVDAQQRDAQERAGLGTDPEAWRRYADRIRNENDQLKRENEQLKDQLALARATSDSPDRNRSGGF